ncbi:hypothetical protein M9H77_26359 [Catharanthus roseus]|uniref:Uncharacterized protein n=1 Tax=Catharanthus roseus TaxID=4058 RepID=A0ACC0A9X8_CATRO|nr:hypothetical protein M9H77_26359 [Catharanthus roseus]
MEIERMHKRRRPAIKQIVAKSNALSSIGIEGKKKKLCLPSGGESNGGKDIKDDGAGAGADDNDARGNTTPLVVLNWKRNFLIDIKGVDLALVNRRPEELR